MVILPGDIKRGKQILSKSCDKKAKAIFCPLANGDAKICSFLPVLYFDVLRKTEAAGPVRSKPSLLL